MPIFHKIMIVCLYSQGYDSMPIFHEVMIVSLYFRRL